MKTPELIPLLNPFTEWIRDTLDEIDETQSVVARATGIPGSHLSEMKKGRRRLSAENDLRLARYFNHTPGFLLRLQLAHDLRLVQREKSRKIAAEITPRHEPEAAAVLHD